MDEDDRLAELAEGARQDWLRDVERDELIASIEALTRWALHYDQMESDVEGAWLGRDDVLALLRGHATAPTR